MPYTKKVEVPFVAMQRLLKGREITPSELSRVLGCSEATARSRLNTPEKLTLSELDRICRFGHVPMGEIRNAIVR